MKLENIKGDIKSYNRLEKNTFQHAHELINERYKNLELMSMNFYTADGSGYFLKQNKDVDWIITPEKYNPILKYLYDQFCPPDEQMAFNEFFLNNNEANKIIFDYNPVKISLDELRLINNDEEFSYLQIRTTDGFIMTKTGYQKPNKKETLAKKILWSSEKKLARLAELGIPETRIYVLNPNYVRNKLKNSNFKTIWRASILTSIRNNTYFIACERSVHHNLYLRGKPTKNKRIDILASNIAKNMTPHQILVLEKILKAYIEP